MKLKHNLETACVIRQGALKNINVLEDREAQNSYRLQGALREMCMQGDYLLRFLPGRLRWRFADEFDLNVEFLASLELVTVQETVAVNARLHCNMFSMRRQHQQQLKFQLKNNQRRRPREERATPQ